MRVYARSKIRNKISHLLLQMRKRVENEIRGDFSKSGEASFVRSFTKDHAGSKITVFDIGANTGLWANLVAKEATKNNCSLDLHAFEPDATYQGPGVYNRMAISEASGIAQIYKRKDSDQSSLYERRLAKSKQGEAVIVETPTIRLDEYVKNTSIQHIDLLKIDVEGCEVSVLKSLGKFLDPSFVSYIQFEYGITYVDAGNYLLDAYELLRDYRICKMFPNHLEETPYQSNLEDFMFTNYVAIAPVISGSSL